MRNLRRFSHRGPALWQRQFTVLVFLGVSAILAACQPEAPQVSVAASNCVAPAQSNDRDVRRYASRIDEAGACLTKRSFVAGGRTWQVSDIDSGRRGPLHVVLHDDENVAFPVALYGLETLGGRIVVVETGEARKNRGIDPNRYFNARRASARQCPHGAPDPTFAGQVLRGASGTIIAYHSNDNGYEGDGRGGSGAISANRRTESLVPFPASGDPDNVVIVPGRSAQPSGRTAGVVRALNAKGVHVIYERVSAARDDCSLSNHIVLSGGPRYYNVEIQHGAEAAGRRIVGALSASI